MLLEQSCEISSKN